MVTKQPKLDAIDRKILSVLQEDGRISNVDLSEKVGLSPTPCLERVKRLEAANYIEGYGAKLNAQKLGIAILAFVEVSLTKTNTDAFEEFKKAADNTPEIQECHMIAGGFDYLLKVRVANMAGYRKFLGETLSELPGVFRTNTFMAMEETKSSNVIAF